MFKIFRRRDERNNNNNNKKQQQELNKLSVDYRVGISKKRKKKKNYNDPRRRPCRPVYAHARRACRRRLSSTSISTRLCPPSPSNSLFTRFEPFRARLDERNFFSLSSLPPGSVGQRFPTKTSFRYAISTCRLPLFGGRPRDPTDTLLVSGLSETNNGHRGAIRRARR